MQYIDSALESALIALFEMASNNKDLWISDLRNLICTSFDRGWRVNGEQSGRTKLIYVFNYGSHLNCLQSIIPTKIIGFYTQQPL